MMNESNVDSEILQTNFNASGVMELPYNNVLLSGNDTILFSSNSDVGVALFSVIQNNAFIDNTFDHIASEQTITSSPFVSPEMESEDRQMDISLQEEPLPTKESFTNEETEIVNSLLTEDDIVSQYLNLNSKDAVTCDIENMPLLSNDYVIDTTLPPEVNTLGREMASCSASSSVGPPFTFGTDAPDFFSKDIDEAFLRELCDEMKYTPLTNLKDCSLSPPRMPEAPNVDYISNIFPKELDDYLDDILQPMSKEMCYQVYEKLQQCSKNSLCNFESYDSKDLKAIKSPLETSECSQEAEISRKNSSPSTQAQCMDVLSNEKESCNNPVEILESKEDVAKELVKNEGNDTTKANSCHNQNESTEIFYKQYYLYNRSKNKIPESAMFDPIFFAFDLGPLHNYNLRPRRNPSQTSEQAEKEEDPEPTRRRKRTSSRPHEVRPFKSYQDKRRRKRSRRDVSLIGEIPETPANGFQNPMSPPGPTEPCYHPSYTLPDIKYIIENLKLNEDTKPLEKFLASIPDASPLKKSELVLITRANIAFQKGRDNELYDIITRNYFSEINHKELQNLWYEAHYREGEKIRGRRLCAVDKFRIRGKYQPPRTIWDGEKMIYCFKERARRKLKEFYRRNKYPNKREKEDLSQVTCLSLTQIRNWFKNRRQRERIPQKKISLELIDD